MPQVSHPLWEFLVRYNLFEIFLGKYYIKKKLLVKNKGVQLNALI